MADLATPEAHVENERVLRGVVEQLRRLLRFRLAEQSGDRVLVPEIALELAGLRSKSALLEWSTHDGLEAFAALVQHCRKLSDAGATFFDGFATVCREHGNGWENSRAWMYTDIRAPSFTFDAEPHDQKLIPLRLVFETYTGESDRLVSIQRCVDFRSASGPAPEIPVDALVLQSSSLTDSDIAVVQDMVQVMSANQLRAIECLEVGVTCSPVQTLQLLATVLDVSTTTSSLMRVSFTKNRLTVSRMASLCSHLRYSCSLREIEFDTSAAQVRADLKRTWRWLAFALFCPWPVARADGAFQLRKITLCGRKLSLSSVKAFKRTLQDPAELAGTAIGWRGPDGTTHLVIVRRCLVEQRTTAFAAASTSADPVATIAEIRVLEVVYSQPQWVCAVYPGVGLAWILSKHVTMLPRGSRSESAVVQRRSRYDLALSACDSDANAIDALLTSIRRHVRELSLPYYSTEVVSAPTMALVLDGIAAQCLFLEHLDLGSWRFEDSAVDALLDALQGDLGSRLPILADTQRRCALRELRVHTLCSWLETRTIERLSDALHVNRTLEVLELDHARLRDNPAGHVSVQRLQTVFHGQVLHAALPRATKRAFLSVIAASPSLPLLHPEHSTSGQASARHAIDAVIVTTVFSHFVPRDMRRHVMLVQK